MLLFLLLWGRLTPGEARLEPLKRSFPPATGPLAAPSPACPRGHERSRLRPRVPVPKMLAQGTLELGMALLTHQW